jgi:hypothetical protein
MRMTGDNAMLQASATAQTYAQNAVEDLCVMLGIDRRKAGWREELAPFAPVLATMIRAAAQDYMIRAAA